MLIDTFSYTSHHWQLKMARYLDNYCRSNGTLFHPDSRLPYLQTRMSFLKPKGTETVCTHFLHSEFFSNKLGDSRIIRIISIIPSFAVISFLCVWQDASPAPYIEPGRDIGEAVAMAAFFLLMSTYVAPDERDQGAFFAEMALLDKDGILQGGGSRSWYQVRFPFGQRRSQSALTAISEIRLRCPPVGASQHHTMDRDSYQPGCGDILYYLEQYPLRTHMGLFATNSR